MARLDELKLLRGQLQEMIDRVDRLIETETAQTKPVRREKIVIQNTGPRGPRDDDPPPANSA